MCDSFEKPPTYRYRNVKGHTVMPSILQQSLPRSDGVRQERPLMHYYATTCLPSVALLKLCGIGDVVITAKQ